MSDDTASSEDTGATTLVAGSVVAVDSSQLLGPGIERLQEAGVDVTVLPDGTPPAEAANAAADAAVILDGTLHLGRPEIEQLRAVRLIVRAGIGYDIIDVDAATERGIWVANVPDYCVNEVADHTLLLLLATSRRMDVATTMWREGQGWYRYDELPPVHRPSERVLGIVGMGRIGASVAARARAVGWRIIGADAGLAPDAIRERGADPVDIEELLTTADAITLHCPLTEETHHLIDAGTLARTRPGLVVVNTSRGGLVDIDALDAAMERGHVSAVGLDVLEDEPDPDLSHPLLHRPNAIITSHVAWYSSAARRELALLCADEALLVLRGRPPRNAVNPDARS